MPFVIPEPGPTRSTFTEGIQASMEPWAPPGSDFDLLNQALASMFETVYGLVMDQGSPDDPVNYQAAWSILLDPTALAATFPVFLPWLALFVGAQVPIGAAASSALGTILGEQGFGRGQGFGGTYDSSNGAQGGAIVTAVQSQLSGTQNVTLLERTNAAGSPDAYWFVVVVQTAQVVSVPALTAAVNAVKPGGVQWTLIETSSWLIGALEAGYTPLSVMESTFASVGAMEGDVT